MNKLSALQVLEGIQESHRRTSLKISPPERDRTLKPYGRFSEEEQDDPLVNLINEINLYVKDISKRLATIEDFIVGDDENEPGSEDNERSAGFDGSSHSKASNADKVSTRSDASIHQDGRNNRSDEQNTKKTREPNVR